jgi:hypothetical protein
LQSLAAAPADTKGRKFEMRVYKFLSAEFGLKSLWEKRLKIATIDELYDPFDLLLFKILDRSRLR